MNIIRTFRSRSDKIDWGRAVKREGIKDYFYVSV